MNHLSPARTIQSGNPAAPIWVLGEAPGADEIATGRPFTGASGHLLTEMLTEAGFDRSQLFLTNVCHERPPGKDNDINQWFLTKTAARAAGVAPLMGRYPLEPVRRGLDYLQRLLNTHEPQFVLALGGTALWALTGHTGILKWRGSVLTATETPRPLLKLVPTAHPAAVLREWSLRNIVVQDLRRARRESIHPEVRRPEWLFLIRPTADAVLFELDCIETRLADGPLPLACDIETRGGHIACFGIATSKTWAMCIPFMCVESRWGYWTEAEEVLVIRALARVLTHPNARLIFQNGAYDVQYIARHWGILPRVTDDTMLMQHVAFPGMRKGLDFLSSLYCSYHRYWKDDGKEWDSSIPEEQYWTYNCEDCVRTYECFEVLTRVIHSFGLDEQYAFQMKSLFPRVVRMMLRGIRVDFDRRAEARVRLERFVTEASVWLTQVLGHPLNPESNLQCMRLIYEDFGIPEIKNRKTHNRTLDSEAIAKLKRKYPLLRPLLQAIEDIRSANTVLSNVLEAQIDPDGRARSTINMAGAETFRFSSSKDAFGFGFNMQNLTKGDE